MNVRIGIGFLVLIAFLGYGLYSLLFVYQKPPTETGENVEGEEVASIADLVLNSERYDNQTVKVRGILVYDSLVAKGESHYKVEDNTGRIQLIPEQLLENFRPYAGREVIVVGTFYNNQLNPMMPYFIYVQRVHLVRSE